MLKAISEDMIGKGVCLVGAGKSSAFAIKIRFCTLLFGNYGAIENIGNGIVNEHQAIGVEAPVSSLVVSFQWACPYVITALRLSTLTIKRDVKT